MSSGNCVDNVLLLKLPGAGTSRLARRLATLLPAMRPAEALETTRIHRVAGLTGGRTAVVTTRPFRAPHYTISDVGLIGGGHLPLPGEVSLAHNGVLLLDELPQFRRHMLEVLRQPLEESVFSNNHFVHILDLTALAVLAARVHTAPGSHETLSAPFCGGQRHD
jgi:magnesium chelatase family protein